MECKKIRRKYSERRNLFFKNVNRRLYRDKKISGCEMMIVKMMISINKYFIEHKKLHQLLPHKKIKTHENKIYFLLIV
jgi:hypothetical protein